MDKLRINYIKTSQFHVSNIAKPYLTLNSLLQCKQGTHMINRITTDPNILSGKPIIQGIGYR